MRPLAEVADIKALARRRVPRMFYQFVDGGSWTEQTYRANRSDFAAIRLRQRVAVDVSARTTAGTMGGQAVAMPVAIAPTGLAGMIHADGEILEARAAARFGIPFTLSTMSVCSLEDVAGSVDRPIWFQLYIMRDRGFVDRLIDRAAAVGCSALVLTVDLPMIGQRHKDLYNGLSSPPKLTPRTLAQLASKPRWCLSMLRTKRRTFGNLAGHVEGLGTTVAHSKWVDSQIDPSMSWDDVRRVRDRWRGTLIVKGILDPEDAVAAADAGADAIIVSNHGGRQLDGALSSIAALPAIADAVGHRTELHLDGGVQSGQDVFKAIALGAKGVYIGRAALYGLGALGEPGVTRVLEILRRELDLTMGFCGARSVAEITAERLVR
jgi:L-lactate dehydrogenase (cytochrome)